MTKKTKNLLLCLFIFLSCFCQLINLNINEQALAQETNNEIIVSPSIIDEQAKARDIFKYDIRLKNNTERKIELYAMVNDISMTDGIQEFLDPAKLDNKTSLARWISIKRGVLELSPGSELLVPLEIKVNLTAEPGKRHAVITFSEGSNRKEAEEKMSKMVQPQIMINFEIEEEIVEKAQLTYFKSEKNVFLQFPVILNLEMKNLGNKSINPKGAIYIYNRRGEEVKKIVINENNEEIAPDSANKITKEWNDGLNFGKFKAKVEIEYGVNSIRDIQDVIYFYILPWKILLIFGIGLFVFIFLLVIAVFKKTYSRDYLEKNTREHSSSVINLRNSKQ